MTTLSLAADTDTAPERVRDKPAAARSRVQFDLPPRSVERLNALKRKTEAASYAEVVKNALRLYEALIEETEAGKQFLVRDREGGISPLRLFL